MDYYAIGQRIRKIRKIQGLSQEQLAERVGISVTHMSHIETGNTKLSLSVLVELATILKVRTDELLYDENNIGICDKESIVRILEGCTVQEMKILEDVLKATKMSLDKNL